MSNQPEILMLHITHQKNVTILGMSRPAVLVPHGTDIHAECGAVQTQGLGRAWRHRNRSWQ